MMALARDRQAEPATQIRSTELPAADGIGLPTL
jgi:hypothetical protein